MNGDFQVTGKHSFIRKFKISFILGCPQVFDRYRKFFFEISIEVAVFSSDVVSPVVNRNFEVTGKNDFVAKFNIFLISGFPKVFMGKIEYFYEISFEFALFWISVVRRVINGNFQVTGIKNCVPEFNIFFILGSSKVFDGKIQCFC